MTLQAIVFIFLSASINAKAEESTLDKLWRKQVTETVEKVSASGKCKGMDQNTLISIAFGDSAAVPKVAGNADVTDCLRAIHDDLHGKRGVCDDDTMVGYGFSYADSCKKSQSSLRGALKRANEKRSVNPVGAPESGQP